ncbi:hypothetical protein CONCODRAFT_2327 [Conidiobolus coronatus NRRL 28638]|uniref:Uncharacterized protein n=1 Tax=Conidiobolus coronatus (strain ATCC 28846 / CBS 209.66 / NRRL 28638) TaxID=796925 RepID=A0A137PHR0_CONC2|nr:hypothetical protein CONCODRAFT_2327 [Conidiobolus coronatus NRRL 28638]|eukprot:KXN74528.1 hypothetical protein CONCODRAFT_2327 [Conidiobolus coronatus NRRL 28638]
MKIQIKEIRKNIRKDLQNLSQNKQSLSQELLQAKDMPSGSTDALKEAKFHQLQTDSSFLIEEGVNFNEENCLGNYTTVSYSQSSPKIKVEFETDFSFDFDQELIQSEKDFTRVFIEGNYSKIDNPLAIEISNHFFSDICLKSFQVDYLIERLPSNFKLINHRADSRFENQLDELTNLYSIPIEDIEYKFDWKLQVNSCQSFEKVIPRCSHCVTKQTDACRFKGIRILAIDFKTSRVILTPPQWQHYSKYVTSYPLMIAQGKNREKIGKKYKEINEELKIYEKLNKNVPIIECEESQPLEDFQKVNYQNIQKYI